MRLITDSFPHRIAKRLALYRSTATTTPVGATAGNYASGGRLGILTVDKSAGEWKKGGRESPFHNSMDPGLLSDVKGEDAIELLARTQECSAYFRDFDFQQLLDLVSELTILYFKEGESVLQQGEPATFFGVILKGSLMPVVGDKPVGSARIVGDIVGEMALFTGGTRNVSIVASEDGYLAVFQFTQLERLKRTNPGLATKLNHQLATAAFEKQSESDGVPASRLSPAEREAGLNDLLHRQAQQHWDAKAPAEVKKQESLLRKATISRKPKDGPSSSRDSTMGKPTPKLSNSSNATVPPKPPPTPAFPIPPNPRGMGSGTLPTPPPMPKVTEAELPAAYSTFESISALPVTEILELLMTLSNHMTHPNPTPRRTRTRAHRPA